MAGVCMINMAYKSSAAIFAEPFDDEHLWM